MDEARRTYLSSRTRMREALSEARFLSSQAKSCSQFTVIYKNDRNFVAIINYARMINQEIYLNSG